MKKLVRFPHSSILLRWSEKYLFVTNLFRITCAKFYKNWLSFVEDITKTILVFFMVSMKNSSKARANDKQLWHGSLHTTAQVHTECKYTAWQRFQVNKCVLSFVRACKHTVYDTLAFSLVDLTLLIRFVTTEAIVSWSVVTGLVAISTDWSVVVIWSEVVSWSDWSSCESRSGSGFRRPISARAVHAANDRVEESSNDAATHIHTPIRMFRVKRRRNGHDTCSQLTWSLRTHTHTHTHTHTDWMTE